MHCAAAEALWLICLIIVEFGVRSPRSMRSPTKPDAFAAPFCKLMIRKDSVPPWAGYRTKHWVPAFLLLVPVDVHSSPAWLHALPPSSPSCLQHLRAAASLWGCCCCLPSLLHPGWCPAVPPLPPAAARTISGPSWKIYMSLS